MSFLSQTLQRPSVQPLARTRHCADDIHLNPGEGSVSRVQVFDCPPNKTHGSEMTSCEEASLKERQRKKAALIFSHTVVSHASQ